MSHPLDTTFEAHYTIGDLARQWKLGRETVRLLVKDEPDVLKIRMGRRKALTRYSIPESVARAASTRDSSIPPRDDLHGTSLFALREGPRAASSRLPRV